MYEWLLQGYLLCIEDYHDCQNDTMPCYIAAEMVPKFMSLRADCVKLEICWVLWGHTGLRLTLTAWGTCGLLNQGISPKDKVHGGKLLMSTNTIKLVTERGIRRTLKVFLNSELVLILNSSRLYSVWQGIAITVLIYVHKFEWIICEFYENQLRSL